MKTLLASLFAVAMVFTLNGCAVYGGGGYTHHHVRHHHVVHHRHHNAGMVSHKHHAKVVETKKVEHNKKVEKETK